MTMYQKQRGDKIVLMRDNKCIGEYNGNLFIRSFAEPHIEEGEHQLVISEDVLLFNKSIGVEDMVLYCENLVIHTTLDEFMGYGDWRNYKNGDWVIQCPIKYLRDYDNVKLTQTTTQSGDAL